MDVSVSMYGRQQGAEGGMKAHVSVRVSQTMRHMGGRKARSQRATHILL